MKEKIVEALSRDMIREENLHQLQPTQARSDEGLAVDFERHF